MSPRGYCRFYPKEANSLAPLRKVRDALDPVAGFAPCHRELDKIASAMPWRDIRPQACSPEMAHALALDRDTGPPRLKAIVYRAYQAGDAFADAMAQDREDRDFARKATSYSTLKKGQTLATLLDALVGGGPSLGGFPPNHVRLFNKYLDGGAPWEAFEMRYGLLQRAISVLERDPSSVPGEAEDLFYRAQSAIACLDDIRDALLRRRERQPRFSLRLTTEACLTSAIGKFFTTAFEVWAREGGRLVQRAPPPELSRAFLQGLDGGALWRGSGFELHRCLQQTAGTPVALEAFLDELDQINAAQMAHNYGLGFERADQVITIWSLDLAGKVLALQETKPQDLPRFFFVARLAETFVASTGDVPTFSNSSLAGRIDTIESRWHNLFHAAIDVTGLVTGDDRRSNANRRTLLRRLAGKGSYAIEGAGNRVILQNVARLFDNLDAGRPIDWSDGLLTYHMVEWMRPLQRSATSYEERLHARRRMATMSLDEENS